MIKHAVISIINEAGSCLTMAYDGSKYETPKALLRDMVFDIDNTVGNNVKWLEQIEPEVIE